MTFVTPLTHVPGCSMQDAIVEAGGHIKQPFMASLNVGEVELLQAYAAKHPDQAWQLNQNPRAGHGMNSNDKWLHTLIHNCGLTFDLTLAIAPPISLHIM